MSRRAYLARARVLAARGWCVLLALVLLAGIARAGARYVYCPMMGATLAASCCAHGPEETELEQPAVESPECCKGGRVGALPAVGTVASFELAPASVVVVLPPFDFALSKRSPHPIVSIKHRSRAGPPSAKARRAELMVWTT